MASRVKPKMVVESRLVAMTTAAQRVAAAARSLRRREHNLEVLAILVLLSDAVLICQGIMEAKGWVGLGIYWRRSMVVASGCQTRGYVGELL